MISKRISTLLIISTLLFGCTKVNNSTTDDSQDYSSITSLPTQNSSSTPTGEYEYQYVSPHYSGTYYNNISNSLRGNTLKLQLDVLLDATDAPSGTFSYKKLPDIFPYTDADPSNPSSGKILSFYSGKPSSYSQMNREHTWPDSRGGSAVEADPHMTRPTLVSENSDRGNSFYNESPTKWDPASFGVPKYRGISARIIFYAAVKAQESGLKLVDFTNDATSNKSMGKLSTLLKWNLEYDIDATEVLRNDTLVSRYGHCRNPFIDNRNYACMIWGDTNDATKAACNRK